MGDGARQEVQYSHCHPETCYPSRYGVVGVWLENTCRVVLLISVEKGISGRKAGHNVCVKRLKWD
jgi:hypothetical protein